MRNYVYKESEGLYERSMQITGAVSLFVNVAGPIANKYGAKCFAAGTVVHTRTGLKAIEDIALGDEVLSYDEETGMQGYKPVVRLYRNVTEEWYHIHVNGEELRCTAEHPFYVVGKGFVPARGIHSLDKVLQSDGRYGIIETVEIEYVSTPEATYNFEVAEYHTYYVGNGILTHNKCGDDVEKIANDLGYSKVKGVRSHGQAVFENKKTSRVLRYISRDVDSHSGGFWKAAETITKLGTKSLRTGTYDIYLRRIGP